MLKVIIAIAIVVVGAIVIAILLKYASPPESKPVTPSPTEPVSVPAQPETKESAIKKFVLSEFSGKIPEKTRIYWGVKGEGLEEITVLRDRHEVKGIYLLVFRKKGYEDVQYEVDMTVADDVIKPKQEWLEIKFNPTKKMLQDYNEIKRLITEREFEQALKKIEEIDDPDFRDVPDLKKRSEQGLDIMQKLLKLQRETEELLHRGEFAEVEKKCREIERISYEGGLSAYAFEITENFRDLIWKANLFVSVLYTEMRLARVESIKNIIEDIRKITPLSPKLKDYENQLSQILQMLEVLNKFEESYVSKDIEGISKLFLPEEEEIISHISSFLEDTKVIRYKHIIEDLEFSSDTARFICGVEIVYNIAVDGKDIHQEDILLKNFHILLKKHEENWRIARYESK